MTDGVGITEETARGGESGAETGESSQEESVSAMSVCVCWGEAIQGCQGDISDIYRNRVNAVDGRSMLTATGL